MALKLWGLLQNLNLPIKQSNVQTLPSLILTCIMINFVDHKWECTSIYRSLSYHLRFFFTFILFFQNTIPVVVIKQRFYPTWIFCVFFILILYFLFTKNNLVFCQLSMNCKSRYVITWMLHQIFMYSNKVILSAG